MGHDNNDISPDRPTRPISTRSQLEHILNQLSAQDLRDFVIETALRDKELREAILVSFSDLLSSDQPEESRYRMRLYKILAQYTNQDGYISHKNSNGLAEAVTALLNTARKATTPTRESVDLCTAVICIMPKIGEKMDDSEGHLYELMQLSCTILLECFDNLKPEGQQICFERILGIYGDPDFLDLDLDSFLLELLKEWSKTDKSRQSACLRQQESMLNDSGDDQWRKNYLLEQTNNLIGYWKEIHL